MKLVMVINSLTFSKGACRQKNHVLNFYLVIRTLLGRQAFDRATDHGEPTLLANRTKAKEKYV